MRLTDLNPPQRSAVTTLRGPLLVLAGAGTGKTRVITARVAHLIAHGTPADRILAVTFTNKAAREMKERALQLLGKRPKGAPTPEMSTFHSLCVRILRRNIERLGYPSQFSIYDRGDQETLARQALRDIRVGHETLRPGDLLSSIGGWKTVGLRPADAEKSTSEEGRDRDMLAAMAYRNYETQLRARGAVDFDDLLLLTLELFERFEDVREAEAGRFDHILIDEYQDTNALQYRIIRYLAATHRNLCVVGDDDQSIYGWRGAEVTHILHFQRDWPEAKVVRLEDNYRCCPPILQLANTLIARNRTRYDKTLRPYRLGGEAPLFLRCEDEAAEARNVVERVVELLKDPARPNIRRWDIAILFRTNEQTRAFELELHRARVPYVVVGGTSFFDRKEVKDVISYLRVLGNPTDEVSLLRILNTPPRGIGPTTVERLLSQAVSQGAPLMSILERPLSVEDLTFEVRARIGDFVALLRRYREMAESQPLDAVLVALLTEIGYKREIERVHANATDADARWSAVEQVVNAAATYTRSTDQPTLTGFLDDCALGGRDDFGRKDRKDERPDAVTLMTLHSAKGLEFPHVLLIGMEEGLLPHHRTILEARGAGIEEERRLCYVGVTRAKETLTLSYAKGRMKWGKLRPSIPSRFLLEMRGDDVRAEKAAQMACELFGRDETASARSETAGSDSGGERAHSSPSKSRNSPSKRARSSAEGGTTAPDDEGAARSAAPRRRQRQSVKPNPTPTARIADQPATANPSSGTRSGTASRRRP